MTTLCAYAIPERGRDCWSWVILRCPFCGKRHSHGGGPLDGDPRKFLGSRVPHCVGGRDGMYVLVETEEERHDDA